MSKRIFRGYFRVFDDALGKNPTGEAVDDVNSLVLDYGFMACFQYALDIGLGHDYMILEQDGIALNAVQQDSYDIDLIGFMENTFTLYYGLYTAANELPHPISEMDPASVLTFHTVFSPIR
jgi:hypothetical protein